MSQIENVQHHKSHKSANSCKFNLKESLSSLCFALPKQVCSSINFHPKRSMHTDQGSAHQAPTRGVHPGTGPKACFSRSAAQRPLWVDTWIGQVHFSDLLRRSKTFNNRLCRKQNIYHSNPQGHTSAHFTYKKPEPTIGTNQRVSTALAP